MELREVTVSGYRGVWGHTLTPDIGKAMANAYVKYTGAKKVAVGMDTRPSSPLLKAGVVEGLNIAGTTAIDMGIVPTPTTCINAKDLKIPAIMITASHNLLKDKNDPLKNNHWNGLKFIGADGLFLDEKKVNEFGKVFADVLSKGLVNAPVRGKLKAYKDPFDNHLGLILKNINADLIRERHFKVVLDAVNGAGSLITKILLEKLGCTVIPLFTDIDAVARTGDFPRGPEPTPQNLAELCRAVIKHKADLGVAQDPDADRLSFVDENGLAIGEENTLAIAVFHILSKYGQEAKKVVINQSTTRAIDDISEKFGVKVVRTKIGEINVTSKMIELGSMIGGEGNGGVIFPPVCFNRDSLSGTALLLEEMAESGSSLSQIVSSFPRYYMRKAKSGELASKKAAASAVKEMCELYKSERLDFTDGIKVIFDADGSWVHVRASNTESIIRIIAEASTQEAADKLVEDTAKKLKIKLVNEKE